MALGTFIAGRFVASYDPPGATAAADLGISEDGYEISWRYGVEPIAKSDAHGDAFLDGIFRGIVDCFVQATLLEWKQGVLNALAPWSQVLVSGATYLGPGTIGRLMSDNAGTLVFSSTAGTPAVLSPASLTVGFAILAENQDVLMLLHSKLRKVPIRFRALPYADTAVKYWTAT